MERGPEKEKENMKCHVCGGELKPTKTDLPFKLAKGSIVIVKALPVRQCENCREYLIEDSVMARVDDILEKAGKGAELEVVRFAA